MGSHTVFSVWDTFFRSLRLHFSSSSSQWQYSSPSSPSSSSPAPHLHSARESPPSGRVTQRFTDRNRTSLWRSGIPGESQGVAHWVGSTISPWAAVSGPWSSVSLSPSPSSGVHGAGNQNKGREREDRSDTNPKNRC